MKTRLTMIATVLLCAVGLGRAQVSVEVLTEQDKFLPAEMVPVAVKIVNRSGRTLTFGDQPDWLTFSVQGRDGFVVEKTGDTPVLGKFRLESSEVATRRVDLAPYFQLTRTGGYKIEATVLLPDLAGQVTSRPKNVDVIEGAILWTQEFGVPQRTPGTNQPLEVRRYTLLKANYLKNELRLYFRVTDEASGRILKVSAVGPMVSFSDPQTMLDKENNLHLIYQSGRIACLYSMVTPDGELVKRQTYEYQGSRPRLTADDSGKISVTGGLRKPTSNDFPSESETNAAKP